DRMLLAQIRDARYGLVGEVEAVNPAPIQCALGAGYVAVVAPLAVTSDGTFLNVNADTAAAEIAVALGADTFISLTDVDGVSAGDGKGPMRRMSPTMARELIGAGVIHGGMIPKVEACARALAVARAAYIVDGRAPHVVIDALRAADGVGTVVSTDSRE
ncbi:MAG TPA: acetylglutamate kinase, partial [Chloroflexota bacterium]|nr:acetylglutamate kinase [Chloroflexota bacterium]